MEEASTDKFSELMNSCSVWIDHTFSGMMHSFFSPVDTVLSSFDPWTYKFFAVGLFLVTILWVMFILKKDYVNVDQPRKGILFDLRLWTFLSMLPHMIIYWMWSSTGH